MQNLFGTLFLLSIPALIVALFKPSLFAFPSRKRAGITIAGAALVLFFLTGATGPQTQVKGASTHVVTVHPTHSAPTHIPTHTPTPTRVPTPTYVPTSTPTPTLIPTDTPTPTVYVAPQYQQTQTNTQTYQNTQTNTVPYGATALCADGTYSYSQHRSGTCSHHGGVAQWY